MNPEQEELVRRFLDERESLDDAAWQSLLDTLKADPATASMLKEQLLIAELVGQTEVPGRSDFLSQLRQRVTDIESVHANVLPLHRGKRRFWWIAAAAAAVVVLMAGAILFISGPSRTTATARIESATSDVWVSRGRSKNQARPGDMVRIRDTIQVATGGVALVLTDGSRLTLDCTTELGFPDERGPFLRRGRANAQVVPQTQGRPFVIRTPTSYVKVLGTEFRLEAETNGSRVEVASGVVELGAANSVTALTVRAQQAATAIGRTVDYDTHPVADTFVNRFNASAVFGSWSNLLAGGFDGNQCAWSAYIAFATPRIREGQRCLLTLDVLRGGPGGYVTLAENSNWREGSMTANAAPRRRSGATAVEFGPVLSGQTLVVDVTRLVPKDEPVMTLIVESTAAQAMSFASREAKIGRPAIAVVVEKEK